MTLHYTHPYLLDPGHKVTVDLVGLGGGGSRVLTELGCINASLMALGKPGLHVRCWDGDTVSAANTGRQLFCETDLGLNKAVVLTTRINRFYGTEWEAMPMHYGGQSTSNILVTCVDSAMARVMIGMKIERRSNKYVAQPFDRQFYWLDFGNTKKAGQCIIGTLQPIKQPRKPGEKTKATLPTVTKKFPQLKRMAGKAEDDTPSCSLAEALEKQDLFINKSLSVFGCDLIWKLLREGMIPFHGAYVNMETFNVNPIKI